MDTDSLLKKQPKISEHTLSGGIKVIFVSSPSFKRSHASFSFNIGQALLSYRDFSALHLLEHIILDGNEAFPFPSELLAKQDGEVNGAITGERTKIWISAQHELFESNLNVICSLITEPSYDEEKVISEKNIILEELQGQYENISNHLSTAIEKLLWTDSPYADDEKVLQALEEVELADVRRLYKQFLASLQAIVIVGSTSLAEQRILKKLETYFGSIKLIPSIGKLLTLPKNLPALSVTPANFDQAILCFAYGMPFDPSDRLYHPLCFLEQAASMRETGPFFKALRKEKKLVYDIHSDLTFTAKSATLIFETRLSGERTKEALTIIAEQFTKLREVAFDNHYVQHLAEDWIAAHRNWVDEPDFWADSIILQIERNLPVQNMLDKRIRSIQSVTPSSILEAANRLLQPDQLVIVMAGQYSPNTIKETEELIKHLVGRETLTLDPATIQYIQSLKPISIGGLINKVKDLLKR